MDEVRERSRSGLYSQTKRKKKKYRTRIRRGGRLKVGVG